MTIDKYALHHSGGLVMPLLHLHGAGAWPARACCCGSAITARQARADWDTVQKCIADGYDVVSFDGRGLGETRMRYTAMSIDDPSLGTLDFEQAYVSPISGVLADYVYNSLLTGRPYCCS